jgi:hypothetical protein
VSFRQMNHVAETVFRAPPPPSLLQHCILQAQ